MLNPQQILEKKSIMFSIVVAGVVGILSAPVILPHIFHGYHMAHIALHIGGITLAAFLSVLSIAAFLKLRTKRLLFTAIAFGIFILAETVLVIDATWPMIYDINGVSLLEFGHILTFSTLGILAMGVFRND